MYLAMLPQQLGGVLPLPELGHLGREHREDVLLLDGVVRAEVRAELQAGGKELLEGEVARAGVGFARMVEKGPGLTEVVVLGTCVSQPLPSSSSPSISLSVSPSYE